MVWRKLFYKFYIGLLWEMRVCFQVGAFLRNRNSFCIINKNNTMGIPHGHAGNLVGFSIFLIGQRLIYNRTFAETFCRNFFSIQMGAPHVYPYHAIIQYFRIQDTGTGFHGNPFFLHQSQFVGPLGKSADTIAAHFCF